MDSSEVDELEALRKAALATLSEAKTPAQNEEEEEDLDALRQAALITRKQKQIQVLQLPVRVQPASMLPPPVFHSPVFRPTNTSSNNLINLTPGPTGIPPLMPTHFRPLFRPPMRLPLHRPHIRPRSGPPVRGPLPRLMVEAPKRPRQPPTMRSQRSAAPRMPPPKPKETAVAQELKTNDKFSRYDPDSSSDEDDEHISSKKDLDEDSEAESVASEADNSVHHVEESKTKKSRKDSECIEDSKPLETASKAAEKVTEEEPMEDVLTIMDDDDILLAIDDFLEDRPVKISLEETKNGKAQKESISTSERKTNASSITETKAAKKKTKSFPLITAPSKPITTEPVLVGSTVRPSREQSARQPANEMRDSGLSRSVLKKNVPILATGQKTVKNSQRVNFQLVNPSSLVDMKAPSPPRQRKDSDLDSVGSSELSFLSSDSENEPSTAVKNQDAQEREREDCFPPEKMDRLLPRRSENPGKVDLRKKLEARGLTKKKKTDGGDSDESSQSTRATKRHSGAETSPQERKYIKLSTTKPKKSVPVVQKATLQARINTKKGRTTQKPDVTVQHARIPKKYEDFSSESASKPARSAKIRIVGPESAKERIATVERSTERPTGKKRTINAKSRAVRENFSVAFTDTSNRSSKVLLRDAEVTRDTSRSEPKRIVLKKSAPSTGSNKRVQHKTQQLNSAVKQTSAASRIDFRRRDSLSEDEVLSDQKSDGEISDSDHQESTQRSFKSQSRSGGIASRIGYKDEDRLVQRDLTSIKRRVVINNRTSPPPDRRSKKANQSIKDRLGNKFKTVNVDFEDNKPKKYRKKKEKRPRSEIKKLSRRPIVEEKPTAKQDVKLEARIQKIKEQNGRILLRQKEIQQEKEKFG